MKRAKTLPLGIDVGSARTRVALSEKTPSGAVRLIAVASRPTLDDPAAAIIEAWRELGTRERRCVMALRTPDSVLRTARFPKMGRRERERAARFETARFLPYPISDAVVRVASPPGEYTVIGVARRDAVRHRVDAARRAKLRLVAIDDHAFALLRAFPGAAAVLDLGERMTILTIAGEQIPTAIAFELAGRALTAAIVAALGIDEEAAEARKRHLGLAGAGDHVRDALVELITNSLIEARAAGGPPVNALTLAGNGARLLGFAPALEQAVGMPVSLATFPPELSETLPADVVRAAAADWGLAYGLTLHRTA